MRWLLLKDLQILRRSPLLVGLLVVYPIAIALLIGLALSKGPDKPKVAIVNEVPAAEARIALGDRQLDLASYERQLLQSVEAVRVGSRAEALRKVRDGEVLGALIVPAEAARRLQNAVNLTGSRARPTIEIAYNVDGPLQGRFVTSLVDARVAEANRALSGELTGLAARYLGVLLDGGSFDVLGRSFDVLGLRNTRTILQGALATLPPDAPERVALQRVERFAQLAIDNLGLSGPVLTSVGSPLRVKQTVVEGKRTSLDAYAVAIAVTVSLMFVTVLVAAGMLALEREEHAFARLVRGLVSRLGLLVEKIGLAAGCAALVSLAMLCGIGIFVALDWARFPLWVLAIAAGALAFGALGVAIGGLTREVRAASLLAVLLTLPIAFLALVPRGTVSGGVFSVIEVVSAAFPFKPALQALDAAINDAGGLWGPLAHLAILAVAFTAIARVALRRFA